MRIHPAGERRGISLLGAFRSAKVACKRARAGASFCHRGATRAKRKKSGDGPGAMPKTRKKELKREAAGAVAGAAAGAAVGAMAGPPGIAEQPWVRSRAPWRRARWDVGEINAPVRARSLTRISVSAGAASGLPP